jgi:glutamate/tyrosine decarboxylase-like PLP-dependent enzyme
MSSWLPPSEERLEVMTACLERLNRHWETLPSLPLGPVRSLEAIRTWLQGFDFAAAMPLDRLVQEVTGALAEGIVHTAHPRYFGLFNPTPNFPGVLGELITAAFNPQLAAASHAPLAVALEQHTVQALAQRLGLDAASVVGHFTTGGAEANATGALLALTHTVPGFSEIGVTASAGAPVLYASKESHTAWYKIAHQSGLGRSAVRLVATDGTGRMDVQALRAAVREDRASGRLPFLLVGTAGTTNAGMMDPLLALAQVASQEGLWFHVDAAWGGGLALTSRAGSALEGIERADSVTFDAHKWLSAPMGAGILFTRHAAVVRDTFRVAASYMPSPHELVDPYVSSMQWSRRCIGLKVFMGLAAAGWEGVQKALEHQLDMASLLAEALPEAGWRVVNASPVGVVVSVPLDARLAVADVVARVQAEQQAWVSLAQFEGRSVLRACLTSFRTEPSDIHALVAAVARASRAAKS